MKSTEPILILKTYTWPRDSHGLFDYESENITKSRIKINESVHLIRSENTITELPIQTIPSSSFPFLSIEKHPNGFQIKTDQSGEMWLVIDCNKVKAESKGFRLTTGEVVKLGRVKYIVKEVCGYEDLDQIKIENQFIPCTNIVEHMVCRICLVGEEDSDPLISPCNCGGTMKFIHLSCFQKWISSRTIKKIHDNSHSYFVKSLTCEISRCPVQPNLIVQDQTVDLLSIEKVEPPYITLESSSSDKNEYSLHLISLNNKNNVRLGRGHDSDIRISDISVSRCHAIIKYDEGEFVLEDNSSKFGTLVEIKELNMNEGNRSACIQVGRTLLVFTYLSLESDKNYSSNEETDEEHE